MRHLNSMLGRLVNDSCWLRRMTVNSSRGELIITVIRNTTRHEPIIQSSKAGDQITVHTIQLIISRLEVVTLTDFIHAIDPEAVIDVVGYSPEETPVRRGWKRHTRHDLPDVTKYGNEWRDS
ncbi:hypothetical protein ACFQ88_30430 [Paenibacillus sp. NPDC056579]|uniref:hypothetical protein n=1 Tax=Paenibacillus sp. NPDC056579 TaxID=3345871 RepID=UPI0036CD3B51